MAAADSRAAAPAGRRMLEEIREQPAALRRLVESSEGIADVARWLREAPPNAVRLVAHGTSDNAATFGVYAFGLLPHWMALRDSISLTVYYDVEFETDDSVVIALSQSGETPDVVQYVEHMRARGTRTLAITNAEDSTLARLTDRVLLLHAGPEHAVAATKTYVNSLGALALLAGHAGGHGREVADALRATADLLAEETISLERSVATMAVHFSSLKRMFVIGRGVELATAREIALKLQEAARVAADALTATDLAHGPVAAVDRSLPIWAIATTGESLPAVVEATKRARALGAQVIASGAAAGSIDDASFLLPTSPAPMPLLSPLISVLPGQLFAHALGLAKGLDPDAPTGLSKVTRVP
jgi:glucosamine--fructose-6-phosphate aminotransferase (isomerizing)